jgi:hypothetical protein
MFRHVKFLNTFHELSEFEDVSEDGEASLERHVQLGVPLLDTCLYQWS